MWPVILRNAASGYLRDLVILLVGFLVTPLMVRELGTDDYGLWVLVLAATAYFVNLDLGLRGALSHQTAVHRARNEEHVIREAVGPFFLIFIAIGLLILAATVLLAVLLPHIFNVEPHNVETGRFVILVIGGAWALQFPSNAAVGVLLGYERYDGNNALTAASRLVQGAGTVAALLLGAGLEVIALIVAATVLAKGAAQVALAYRVVPGFGISLRSADLAHVRSATKRSVSFFVNSSGGLLTRNADEILIGAFLTVSAVGVYGVGLRVVNLTRSLSSQVDAVLLPVLSRLTDSEAGRRELGDVMLKATRITAGLAGGTTLVLIVFGRPFLELWIGAEVEDAYYPLVILSVMSYVAMVQSLNVRLLLASDKHRVSSLLTLGSMVVNLAVSLALIERFELIGVATGSLVAVAAPALIRIHMGCQIAGLSPLRFIASGMLPSTLPALAAGLAGFGLQEVWPVHSWALLAAEAGAVLVLYGVPLVLLSFPLRRTWAVLQQTFAVTFQAQRGLSSAGPAGPARE